MIFEYVAILKPIAALWFVRKRGYQHKFIRSEHKFICSEHKFIRSEHKFIRSEHKFIRSEHKSIRLEHKFIRSQCIGYCLSLICAPINEMLYLVLIDPNESFVVRAAESESQQGYTPFEGVELSGRAKTSFLRGRRIYYRGQILGVASGLYLKRR